MKRETLFGDSAHPQRRRNNCVKSGATTMFVCFFALMSIRASVDAADKQPIFDAKPGLSAAPFVEWNSGNRKILQKQVIVRASLDDLWRAWTTSEGIATFFVPESNVDLRIGGPYELFMGMDQPDESGLRGSESCRILSYLRNEMLSFEWNFPPGVMALRKSGAKTHVVIRFKDLGDGQVQVTLSQLGWGHGAEWKAGYDYFDSAWDKVLSQLKEHFDQRAMPASEDGKSAEPASKSWTVKHVTVTAWSGDEKRQDFELEIPAPVEAVWKILTTSEGLLQIGGHDSHVELMPGGKWEFWPTSPERVQSYLPMEMFAATGSAPPQFPEVQKGGHWGVFFLDSLNNNRTKLRMSVVGWKQGDEWDRAFDYFLKNNPVFLEWIHDALAFPVNLKKTPASMEVSCFVAASRKEVWKAFATEEGLESWMLAHAKIDLRLGGKWLAHYDKKGKIGDPNTIENIILCHEPERMLAMKIGKPPEKFPFREAAKNTWSIVYFDDAGPGRTHVRCVGLGYRDDDESRRMMQFFEQGNRWTLQRLQEKFAADGTPAVHSDAAPQSNADSTTGPRSADLPSSTSSKSQVADAMQSYMAHMAAAGLSLDRGETAEARRWLDGAPRDFRHWEWRYLDADVDQSDRQWTDLNAAAMFVAYRPDGKQVAVATTDGRVLIRDAVTGALIRTIQSNDKALWHVAYNADGSRIATSSSDGTARIWNADSGDELKKLVHEKSQVYSASFSPDGALLATCMLSYVKLWNVETGEEIATLEGHVRRPPVTRVVFSPDGSRLASAGWDNWVILWDVKKREVLHKLGPGYGGEEYMPFNAVVFSPDGRRVAACTGSGKVLTWDAETGEAKGKWLAHDKNVYAIAYSPDTKVLATGSQDLGIRLWGAETGAKICAFHGHTGMIRSVAFSPDGRTLASAATDNSVRFWSLLNPPNPLVVRHEKGVWAARFSPDGSMFATAGSDHAVRVWDSADGTPTAAFEGLPEQAISVAFSPCGRFLAGGTNETSIFLWSLKDKSLVHELKGHKAGVPGLAFNPKGDLLASASYDGTLRLWNPETGDLVRSIEGPEVACIKAEFSPDSQMLATAGKNGVVRLLNVETGAEIAALTGHESRLGCVAFSPDGRWLASAGADRHVRIWDVRSRKAVHDVEAHEDGIYGLAFSPDGARLATTSYDHTVKLWDVQTGNCAATIDRPDEAGYDVTFSPDGRRLAVTFADGSVKVLDSIAAATRR